MREGRLFEKSKPQINTRTASQSHSLQSSASSRILQMQQVFGNRMTERMIRAHIPTTLSTIQLRGENPHAQAGSLNDWELTAHHVIAHSQLLTAFERLSKEEKAIILKQSIPDTITSSMTKNLKIVIKDSDGERDELTDKERSDLRELLVSDQSDDTEFHHIRIGDMRKSFFEWQGGNQFIGPNTSIRAEPSASKDGLDTDGKYFTSMKSDDFEQLTNLGDKLNAKGEESKTFTHLQAILSLTRNIAPNPLDVSKWIEVSSLDTINQLMDKADFDRKHLLGYSFFKFKTNEIGSGKKYDKITVSSGDYYYENKPIDLQVKGSDIYIQIKKAKDVQVASTQEYLFKKILEDRNIPVNLVDDKNYEIPLSDQLTLHKNAVRLNGFPDNIPTTQILEGKVRIASGLLDKKKLTVKINGDSLYTYCEKKRTSTSSFLPRKLYDELMKD